MTPHGFHLKCNKCQKDDEITFGVGLSKTWKPGESVTVYILCGHCKNYIQWELGNEDNVKDPRMKLTEGRPN